MKSPSKILLLTGCCLAIAAGLQAQTRTITNGLVAHLTFDNTLNDNTGRGNNGTYDSHNSLGPQPSSPTYVPGKLGQAFEFTTALDASLIEFVTMGYPEDLRFYDTNSWSISFWINNTNNQGDCAMIANKNWWTSGNPGFGIFFQNNGNFRVQMTDSVNTGQRIAGTRPEVIRDGNWHHIVVTLTVGGTRKIYLDGNLIDTAANTITGGVDTFDQQNGESLPFAINIGQDGTGGYNDSAPLPPPALATGGDSAVYGAKIDDVGFWKRALTDVEVANIYNFAQLGTNLFNVPDVHTPVILSFNPQNAASGVPPNIPTTAVILNQDSSVNASTLQLSVDGSLVAYTLTTSGATNTVTYTQPFLFAPLSTHTNKITFLDNSSPTPNRTTKINVYTVYPWTNIYLGTPLYFENFEELTLDTTPPAVPYSVNWHGLGWTANNCTDPSSGAGTWDLNNDNSDAYLDWQLTTVDTIVNHLDWGANVLNIAGVIVENGQVVSTLVSNQVLYGVSDPRAGSQILYLYTVDYNLSGHTNVYVSFHSAFTKNQDDVNALEYSIDQGFTWQPVVYMIDGRADNDDFVYFPGGGIDASNIMAKLHSDVAYCNATGDGNYYGYFIGVPPDRWATLGPYISGRINDDQIESHRVETYRLPLADNQPKVRFRFSYAGTCSWDWAIDNFGIYSIPAAPPLQITSPTRSGNNITINWNGTGPNGTSGLQKTTGLNPPVWRDIPGTIGQNSYTEPITGTPTFYRAVRF
jgi:hypothetical protein